MKMEDKSTLGKFIQTKRKELGLSQKELAKALYVTESAVSKWERGISYPDITMISAYARSCTFLSMSFALQARIVSRGKPTLW